MRRRPAIITHRLEVARSINMTGYLKEILSFHWFLWIKLCSTNAIDSLRWYWDGGHDPQCKWEWNHSTMKLNLYEENAEGLRLKSPSHELKHFMKRAEININPIQSKVNWKKQMFLHFQYTSVATTGHWRHIIQSNCYEVSLRPQITRFFSAGVAKLGRDSRKGINPGKNFVLHT